MHDYIFWTIICGGDDEHPTEHKFDRMFAKNEQSSSDIVFAIW